MTVIASVRPSPGESLDERLTAVATDVRTAFRDQVRVEVLGKVGALLLHFDGPLTSGDIRQRLSHIGGIIGIAEDEEVGLTPVTVSRHGRR
jgi:hypothetical protein